MKSRAFPGRGGFTLVETLMVLTVVGLLVTLAVPFYGIMKAKAGLAGCLGNIRVINVGLSGYLQDNNMVWPQKPSGGFNGDTGQEAKYWLDTLSAYGVSQKNLICPNDGASIKAFNDDPNTAVTSYAVCYFDETPGTAFKWNQPWVMEHSGFHGATRGPNMLMPDGTIVEGVSLNAPSGAGSGSN
jgi:prepilin-type N-terminal cleavage/methylation domain-containing protein